MNTLIDSTALLAADYFELFGLPRSFAIDRERLERGYRALQLRFHPDRFASAPDAERRHSLELSAYINTAYLTLRTSISRAHYLLLLLCAVSPDDNAPMPAAFLMRQMEVRETMELAYRHRDSRALLRIKNELRDESQRHEANLAQALDQAADFARAANCVGMLKFYDALFRDIDRMTEDLEDAHAVRDR